MKYMSADTLPNEFNSPHPNIGPNATHGRLLQHFTGHLKGDDLDYFRKWDRLIDLERHASPADIAKSWLFDSSEKESIDGKCISSLLLDEIVLSAAYDESKDCNSEEDTTIRFFRSNDSEKQTPLLNLNFETGSYVIISTDDTSFVSNARPNDPRNGRGRTNRFARQKLHILRGYVCRVMEHSIDIIVPKKDIGRIMRLLQCSRGGSNKVVLNEKDMNGGISNDMLKFRLDKDEHFNGAGLLLQNLVNFFTLDVPPFSAESLGQTPVNTKSFTANTDYSARRRRLNDSIVRLSPPPRFVHKTFDSLFNTDSSCLDIPGCDTASLKRDFDKLNPDQKGAVLKVRLFDLRIMQFW